MPFSSDTAAGRREESSRWSGPQLPVLAAVAVLVPFVRKAFNVDDPLFLWTAKHIVKDPLRFFDFSVNWYGWEMPMSEVLKNPPGVAYYLAIAGSLAGFSEIAIHLALVLPAAFVAWGTHALARELEADAPTAGLAAVSTPAFVVCGTTVMSDMTMLAGWIWALCLWVRGVRSGRIVLLVAAGSIGAVAMLTKYVAAALVGLFVVYAWQATGRRVGRWLFPALIPIGALVVFDLWTKASYGRGLFFDAASYATRFGSASEVFSQSVTGLAFAGGSALTVLFFAPFLWKRRVLVALAVASAAVLAAVVGVGELAGAPLRGEQGLRWSLLLHLGFFCFSGLGVVVLAVDDLRRSRDAAASLLSIWVLGTIVFACFINWSINLRTLLPLVPAAAILIARRLSSRKSARLARWRFVPLIPSALLALMVGWADYAWANSAREAANRVDRSWSGEGRQVRFQGHWGFQWYMQELGHVPFDFRAPRVSRGDVIVLPTNNTNVRGLDPRLVAPQPEIEVAVHRWLSTMNLEVGAGAYSHISAPLPFAFGVTKKERYFVLVAQRSFGGP